MGKLGKPGAGFTVPAGPVEVEYIVNKSRFIGRIHPVESREEALACIENARRDYPDARHHCWAFVVGPPDSPVAVAQSDDGEPAGTAGKPILNVLEHKRIGNILLVVIRYFGGIKLGAGGLVRAYSHSAQLAVDRGDFVRREPKADYLFRGDFAQEQPLRHWLGEHGGEVVDVFYGDGIRCHIRIPEKQAESLFALGASLGAGIEHFTER